MNSQITVASTGDKLPNLLELDESVVSNCTKMTTTTTNSSLYHHQEEEKEEFYKDNENGLIGIIIDSLSGLCYQSQTQSEKRKKISSITPSSIPEEEEILSLDDNKENIGCLSSFKCTTRNPLSVKASSSRACVNSSVIKNSSPSRYRPSLCPPSMTNESYESSNNELLMIFDHKCVAVNERQLSAFTTVL